MTGPQLTRHVRATLIAAGPTVAEHRRPGGAGTARGVPGAGADAMARLIAYLPAADATTAFTAIDALAGHAAVDGDERSIDQRRADAFSDVFTSILDRQTTPDGTPLPTRHGQRVALQVTVAASTLARPRRRPCVPRLVRADPRAGRPRARPGRHLAPGAHRPRQGQVCSVGTSPTGPARPDPHRAGPGRDLHLPGLPPARRPAARSTTASPTTTPAPAERHDTRPARRTCTPCASITTRPRPRAGGRSPTTPPPASPRGPTATGSPTRATRSPSTSRPTPSTPALPPPPRHSGDPPFLSFRGGARPGYPVTRVVEQQMAGSGEAIGSDRVELGSTAARRAAGVRRRRRSARPRA